MNRAHSLLLIILIIGGILHTLKGIDHPSFLTLQKKTDAAIELSKGNSLEQTFLSTEPYLSSITLPVTMLENVNAPQLAISVCLSEILSSHLKIKIKCKSFFLPRNSKIQEIIFPFSAQPNSLGRIYRISIQADVPSGFIFLWSSFNDAYPDGNLYVNKLKTSKDLSFFTASRPHLLEIIKPPLANSIPRIILMAKFFALFIICGYIILFLLSIDLSEIGIVQTLILCNSIGLSFSPGALYFLGLFNIHLTRKLIIWMSLCLVGLFLLVFIIRLTFYIKNSNLGIYRQKVPSPKKTLSRIAIDQYDFIFFILFIIAFITRLLQVKEILVPNWIDGLVHQGRLEDLFANGVIPVDQIYHIGFHLTAFFTQSLLGLNSPEATLMLGQWLSVVSGTTFYFLATRLFKSKLVSLICLSFYWFLAPFPSYLISWGRYPFLMGLTLLPVAISISLRWLDTKKTNLFFLTSLIVGSLLIVHYSIVIIWGGFLFSFIVYNMTKEKKYLFDKFKFPYIFNLLTQSILLFSILGLFISPKIDTLLKNHNNLINIIKQARSMAAYTDVTHVFYLTLEHAGIVIWTGGVLGLIALFQTNRNIFYMFSIWISSLFLFSYIQMLSLGAAIPNAINLIIFLSMPLTLLCGFVLQHFYRINKPIGFLHNLILGALAGLILIGVYGSLGVVNPATVFFTYEDQRAIAWINQNTNMNDIVLVNSFLWGDQYVPSNGGGWISSFTGRNIVYPLSSKKIPNIQALINFKEICYVYLGRDDDILINSMFHNGHFKLVYRKNNISIYKALSCHN